MYYKTIHFTLYFVGSIPYKAATFPCLNLFDGFQALFRLSFKIRGEVYKSLQFDSSLPTRLHLPLHLPWVTSLWPFGSSLNLWKKPSSFPPQVLDSCCSRFWRAPIPPHPFLSPTSPLKCHFVREAIEKLYSTSLPFSHPSSPFLIVPRLCYCL